MTDATTRKPVPDPVAFGRDLARYAKAEIENVGLAIAEVGVKEQELASIKRRLVRSINLAASARIMEGMPTAEAQAWAKAAAESCGAAMDERCAAA